MITKYRTPYGTVFHSTTCKDDHPNMVTREDFDKEPFTGMTLQQPALRALRAAERTLGHIWKPEHIRVTGSIRSCEQQRGLWLSDKSRFASPDTTLHTQGLAIDVHTGHLNDRVRKALLAHGWKQSRPDDEPWHFSFKLRA